MELHLPIMFDPSILYHCFQSTSVFLVHVRMELHVTLQLEVIPVPVHLAGLEKIAT